MRRRLMVFVALWGLAFCLWTVEAKGASLQSKVNRMLRHYQTGDELRFVRKMPRRSVYDETLNMSSVGKRVFSLKQTAKNNKKNRRGKKQVKSSMVTNQKVRDRIRALRGMSRLKRSAEPRVVKSGTTSRKNRSRSVWNRSFGATKSRVKKNESRAFRYHPQVGGGKRRIPNFVVDRTFQVEDPAPLKPVPSGGLLETLYDRNQQKAQQREFEEKPVTQREEPVANYKPALHVRKSGGTDQSGLLVLGRTEPVYKLQLFNPTEEKIVLDRISFEVEARGLNFAQGMTEDDFKLWFLGGVQTIEPFEVSIRDGRFVSFTAKEEVGIYPGKDLELTLSVALEDDALGFAASDALWLRLLDDSALEVGTNESLRNKGKNFIWSAEGDEFRSGFRVEGLPLTEFVKRY